MSTIASASSSEKIASDLNLRPDLQVINSWVLEKSSVLDLGCGNGDLLYYLTHSKKITGYGLESDARYIQACVEKGVQVIEQDIDEGLNNFLNQSFDVVIMTQALQEIHEPHRILREMLRVGREVIVTFPNFGYWKNRLHLLLKGRMPVSKTLPHHWYDTPNIHLCTFQDFEDLCLSSGYRILARTVVDSEYSDNALLRVFPNLLGEIAIYRITGDHEPAHSV